MVASPEKLNPPVNPPASIAPMPTVTWERLPKGYQLEEEPVDNTGQPLLASALNEALELAGAIEPDRLLATNLGICATIDGELILKAPDWMYIPKVYPLLLGSDRQSYTPHLEGDLPTVVMEFISHTDGGEYSFRRISPLGKWFFYETILKIPTYIIFEPDGGLLEVYRLQAGKYQLELPDPEGRHWFAELGLFLGTWRGEKAGRSGYWLRWWDEAGNLLLWGVEQLAQERQRTEQERQCAEQERQRADRLAALLQARGISLDELENGG